MPKPMMMAGYKWAERICYVFLFMFGSIDIWSLSGQKIIDLEVEVIHCKENIAKVGCFLQLLAFRLSSRIFSG